MQQFSFFDESLLASKRVVFADLGSVIRRKGADETLDEIAGRVEREEPAVVVIDSFKALRDILGDCRGAADVRLRSRGPHRRLGRGEPARRRVHRRGDREPARSSPSPTASSGSSNRRARADRDPRGRGVEAARRGLRHRRSLLRDRRRRARVLPARAQPGRRRSPEPDGARRSASRRASPGSTTCWAAACRGRARPWSRAGRGRARRCSACSSCSRGRGSGEPGIHFTLEETPDQLRRIAQGFGWDLAPFEERGLFTLSYVSPVELSTDRFLDRARQEVERLGARRAVLDSLTSMALGVPSERRFKELVYAIAKHFRAARRDAQHEHGDRGPARARRSCRATASRSPPTTSSSSSTWRSKGASSAASPCSRRAACGTRPTCAGSASSADGVEVGAPFEGLRGVLTGLPVPAEGTMTDEARTAAGSRSAGRSTTSRSSSSRPTAPERGCGACSSCSVSLVPYERCAVLEALLGREPRVVAGARRRRPRSGLVLTDTLVDALRAARRARTRHGSAARAARAGAPRRAAGRARRGGRRPVRALVGDGTYEERARAQALGGRGEARRLLFDAARARRASGARAPARRGAAGRRGGQPGEGRVPGAGLARAQDAAQHDPGLGRRPALEATERSRPRAERSRRSSAACSAQAKLIEDLLDLSCIATAKLRLDLRPWSRRS